MTNPYQFDIAGVVRSGGIDTLTHTGPSPVRIGPAMIAIAEGAEVTVVATVTSLGDGLMVEADVTGPLSGECVRCLSPLTDEVNLHISQVFALSEDFITGDVSADEEDEVPLVENDTIDLTQAITDEGGLTLPFNPVCPGGCDHGDVPEPDGNSDTHQPVDPRWSGLEKFL